MRINVIMPSYLGDYPNAASDRARKLERAIDSFFSQTGCIEKRLFVIGDSCRETTKKIKSMRDRWRTGYDEGGVPMSWRLKMMTYLNLPKKEDLFSGDVRNMGLYLVMKNFDNNDIVCYLDSDDMFMPGHLLKIQEAFSKNMTDAFGTDEGIRPDWVYFNDHVATDSNLNYRTRDNILFEGRIGTSAIAHRIICDVKWQHGYGHDWRFIQHLFAKYPNFKRIEATGYLVCHIPGQVDF